MPLSDEATNVAVLKALRGRVAEAYETARNATDNEMDVGDRKAVRLGDGKLGDVIKASGSRRAKVTDEESFLKWVAEAHPEEIVQSVRASFQSKILNDAKYYGQAVDVTTGELVPGVELTVGEPYITVRLADGADEKIAAHWDEAVSHLPELSGGDSRG